MTNRERSANEVNESIQLFRCPICHQRMKVIHFKSIICSNHHTFDFTKQGYINMLTRSTKQRYDDKLFVARQTSIVESNLYLTLHAKILETIDEYLVNTGPLTIIFDAGCGEGSHLQKIVAKRPNQKTIGIGLDIEKEGIKMAAKNYRNLIWLVGDLANIPLMNESCHVVLNILSPANYMEFNRILSFEGIVVKIVPRSNYLKEFRKVIFSNSDKNTYTNTSVKTLFKEQFHLVDKVKLSFFKKLNQGELKQLAQMSPLTWNMEKEQMKSLINLPGITIDLDILVGKKKP